MYYDHIALITGSDDIVFHREKKRHIAASLGVHPDRISVYRFGAHPDGATVGSFTWHRAVWEHIISHRFERTLILEDNVAFLRRVSPRDFDLFLQRHPEWDVMYFGYSPGESSPPAIVRQTRTAGIVEVRAEGSHAYLINLRTAKNLVQAGFQRATVGDFLRRQTRRTYALFPMRAIQSGHLLSQSYFSGIIQRSSQYLHYAAQQPFNPLRAVFWLIFLILAQPVLLLSSTWMAISKRHDS